MVCHHLGTCEGDLNKLYILEEKMRCHCSLWVVGNLVGSSFFLVVFLDFRRNEEEGCTFVWLEYNWGIFHGDWGMLCIFFLDLPFLSYLQVNVILSCLM
jgi:hypothetical protein